MVPQNNYTLKHNSLTKSSSWRGAHWLLGYGKYERPPYYSSKPKANEVWRFENSHCGGRAVSKTHSDKSVPQPFFPENLWKNETLQLIPGGRQRRSTTNNIDILTLDVCLPPRIFFSFAMISNNKLFQNFTRIPWLSLSISTRNFLQGYMDVDRNRKTSSGRTYNWHSICLRWSDLLMQDHIFLRHSME